MTAFAFLSSRPALAGGWFHTTATTLLYSGAMPFKIAHAESDQQILDCFDAMAYLRPHLERDVFVSRVRKQAETGYRLLGLRDESGDVHCVAGYRVLQQLHYGGVLYIDDLSTTESVRSKGYGNAMFDYLVQQAKALGLDELQLDSGVQRFDAHRFYFRNRMHISSYHFRLAL